MRLPCLSHKAGESLYKKTKKGCTIIDTSFFGWAIRFRTRTKTTKMSCATITP